MTAISSTNFYITGGTVPRDAACYVPRQADIDLLEGLRQGQFCYVLHARQMGKSSLMVRTAMRLRQEGVTCAILDLTAIGQNLDAERWYGGLLNQLGQQVGREDELDDAWLVPSSLGPMQRWMKCLNMVLLKRRTNRLVIFVDEIDAVRNLPFSADEFFAGIRECYNRRSEDPDFERLAFCLLGVATPADLIRDPRTTPFNIGRRIDLTDFTEGEARPLAAGFTYILDGEHVLLQNSEAEALLQRILYWTGGHPYLTQRFCSALTEHVSPFPSGVGRLRGVMMSSTPVNIVIPSISLVDRLATVLFFDSSARERDDNLLFVRERMLRSEVDRASLLDLYHRVRRGRRVLYDEMNPLISVLLLSGIVRVEQRLLAVRNRIYFVVFDHAWIRANMPDAELRRQEAAFRAGAYRAAALASVVVLAMGGLTAWALRERQIALQRGIDAGISATRAAIETKRANHNADLRTAALGVAERRRVAAEREKAAKARALLEREKAIRDLTRQKQTADRLLYIATMGLIPQHYDRGEFDEMRALLEETKNSPYRGFEWGYWNRFSNPARLPLIGHTASILAVAFSPDGQRLVTGSDDRTARVWDTANGRQTLRIGGHRRGISCASFSPDGTRLLTASIDKTVRVWNSATGRSLMTLPAHPDVVTAAAYSRDGRWIATGCGDGIVRIWDATGHEKRKIPTHGDGVTCLAWSLDGRHIAIGGRDARIRVWVAETGQEFPALTGHSNSITSLAYSADGRQIVSASEDNTARITNLDAEREPIVLRGHSGWIYSAAISPDGRRVVTGSADGTARIWDAASGRRLLTVSANTGAVHSVAISPDCRQIATGNEDGTAALWDVGPGQTLNPAGAVRAAAISPDGRSVVTAGDDGAAGPAAMMWDAATGRPVRKLKGHIRAVNAAVFSPDGRSIVTAADDGTAIVWDAAIGRRRLTLKTAAETVFTAAVSSDGRRIMTGGSNGKARIWDAISGHLGLTLTPTVSPKPGDRSNVTAVAFCQDGRRVVMAGIGQTATVWDASTGREVLTLAGHTAPIDAVAGSPDGRWIITGSQDRTAKVWDATTGKLLLTLRGHTGAVTSVACARDGRRLLTSSEDGTAKLWDAETGRELLTLKGHTGAVHSAAWSQDGRRIVTASSDGTAIVWYSY